jgi:hypothetical protein
MYWSVGSSQRRRFCRLMGMVTLCSCPDWKQQRWNPTSFCFGSVEGEGQSELGVAWSSTISAPLTGVCNRDTDVNKIYRIL